MAKDPYPFGLGKRRLPLSQWSAKAQPILLGTRTLEYGNSFHLFASSDDVKKLLEIEIAQDRGWGWDPRVHPTAIELRAAVYSITYFECVAAEYNGRWGVPKVIEQDNWRRIFWTFLRLFDNGAGFIAKWEDRYSYINELWVQEPRYKVTDLSVSSLADDCGKSYSLPSEETVLEYVNAI